MKEKLFGEFNSIHGKKATVTKRMVFKKARLPPVIALLLFWSTTVEARKDREPKVTPSTPTQSPTKQPTSEPSTSLVKVPIARPSAGPTSVPTSTVTIPTAFSPTSENPSFSSSDRLTPSPVSLMTRQPYISPATSSNPSKQPTTDAMVVLPSTLVRFSVLEVVELDVARLETEINSFFTQVLSSNANSQNLFEMVQLQIETTYDRISGRASALITGQSTYRGRDFPTEDDLELALISYFSFWGADDLKAHFAHSNISISEIDVDISGKGVMGIQTGERSSDGNGNVGMLSGAAAGVAAVGLALAFLLARSSRQCSANKGEKTISTVEASPEQDAQLTPPRTFCADEMGTLSSQRSSPQADPFERSETPPIEGTLSQRTINRGGFGDDRSLADSVDTNDLRSYAGLVSVADLSVFTFQH